jgi:dUTP pyrophosphatase
MSKRSIDEDEEISLKVQRLSNKAVLPYRASDGAAGYDLCALESGEINAQSRKLIKTGLKISIPKRCVGKIAARSGLAVRNGIQVGAGVIDSDYTGEIGILLINCGHETFVFEQGQRVAQLLLQRIDTPKVEEVESLEETMRGANGFGSTGQMAVKKDSAEPTDSKNVGSGL